MPILPWSDDVFYMYKKHPPRVKILHDLIAYRRNPLNFAWRGWMWRMLFECMSNPRFQVELTYCFPIDIQVIQRSFESFVWEIFILNATCSNCHNPIRCTFDRPLMSRHKRNPFLNHKTYFTQEFFTDLHVDCTAFKPQSFYFCLNYFSVRYESENVKKQPPQISMMNKQLAHLFWVNNKLQYLQKHNFWVLWIYHSSSTHASNWLQNLNPALYHRIIYLSGESHETRKLMKKLAQRWEMQPGRTVHIFTFHIPLGRGPLSQRAHPRFALLGTFQYFWTCHTAMVCIFIERRSLPFFPGRHCGFHLPFLLSVVIWYYMTEISVRNARSTHALGISEDAFVYTRVPHSSQQLYACNTSPQIMFFQISFPVSLFGCVRYLSLNHMCRWQLFAKSGVSLFIFGRGRIFYFYVFKISYFDWSLYDWLCYF